MKLLEHARCAMRPTRSLSGHAPVAFLVLIVSGFLSIRFHSSELLAKPEDLQKQARSLYEASLRMDDIRAIETLQRARELDPSNADIVYRTGFLYHKMNRTREAESYYNDVIEMHSCMEKAHNNLGSILLARNEIEKAAEHYAAAIRCNPASVTAIYNLANIRNDQGQQSEAIDLYKQAIARNPGHARSQHNLGLILLQRGQEKDDREILKEAETHLRIALKLMPQDALTHFSLANVLIAQKNSRDALPLLRRADTLSSDRPSLQKKIRARIESLR